MSNVVIGAEFNLDKIPLFADTLVFSIESKNLMFASCSQGVYQGYPFYKINMSVNGSALSMNCNEEIFNKVKGFAPATVVKCVVSLDLRYKKVKIIDIESN